MKVNYNFENCGILEDRVELEEQKLEEYTNTLINALNDNSYLLDECSLYLPFDTKFLEESVSLSKNFSNEKLKYVFVIGIGGANLGTKAIYNAIYGELDSFNAEKRYPKLIFIETPSAKYIDSIFKLIENNINSKEEFAINILSKSGNTTETISISEIIIRKLEERFVNISDRVVVTTEYNSKLEEKAKQNDYIVLNQPSKVGGRYSVFSNIGLFPLAISGIDIEQLLEGAKVALVDLVNTHVTNPSLRSAVIRYLLNKENYNINNQFFFNPELEFCGKWYRQLMGESIGKENDVNGNKVNSGIVPIVSIGSTDLHSMAQLFLAGPNNILTYFIYSPDSKLNQKVPEIRVFENLVESINNKSTLEILNAILSGIKSTYIKNNKPFVEIEIPVIDEYSLGMFLQYQMLEMMYLAKLLNVNAFDQPNVEDYKIETKKVLESP